MNNSSQIQRLLTQLAELDQQLIETLAARARASQQLIALAPERLDRILESQPALAEPLSAEALNAVLREFRSGLRQLLRPIRVAFLGPLYSYSHLAAIERFGTQADLVPVTNISDVFAEVHGGQSDFGLVPLENSTDGRVVDTLGMFARRPIRVSGEVQLRINHCLLATCPRDQIQRICSKPQALSQCRDWLATHVPQAVVEEMTSTAAAARRAAREPGVAAIASRQAAAPYELSIVAANIQDNPNNVTRFAVVGGDEPAPTGADKTAVMFELSHEPGALAEVMMIFKNHELNMTWIESFPMPNTPSEYLFFIEFEGHAQAGEVRPAIEDLRAATVRLDILGTYARQEPIG